MKENPEENLSKDNIGIARLMSRRTLIRRILPALLVPSFTMVITESAGSIRRDTGTTPYKFTAGNNDFVFFGGIHGFGNPEDPLTGGEQIKLPENQLNLSGLFLENAGFEYLRVLETGDPETIQSVLKIIEQSHFTQNLVQYAKEKNIPLLFGEIPHSGKAQGLGIAGNFLPVAETMLGCAFFASEKASRREFLKKILSFGIGIWGYSYMLKDLSTTVFTEIMRKPWAKELRRSASFVEFSHPEVILTILRNALIAEKLLWYSEVQRSDPVANPTIGLTMGLLHEYISEYLKRGRKFCQELLKIFPEDFLVWAFGQNYRLYYSKLLELRLDGSFKILTDPDLQERINRQEQLEGSINIYSR